MQKQERTLTPQEQQRKEHFDQLCEVMRADGYHKQDLTVGVVSANVMGLLMALPFCVVTIWLYFNVKQEGEYLLQLNWIFLPLFVAFIVLHEAIHGLTWGVFAKNHFKSIKFGVIWSALTPYCTCEEPLKRWQYLLGGLMPTLILGFGMLAAAIAFHSDLLFLLSECMILGGGGDFLIVLKLLLYRARGKKVLFYDHPYECGLVVFEQA